VIGEALRTVFSLLPIFTSAAKGASSGVLKGEVEMPQSIAFSLLPIFTSAAKEGSREV